MTDSTFVTRVALKNYKSFTVCDVRLGSFNLLVGPNGAGKSNFLDALAFVADALRTSPQDALESRGGFEEVCRRPAEHPGCFGILLEFLLANGQTGRYTLQIGSSSTGHCEVKKEECLVQGLAPECQQSHFLIRSGQLVEPGHGFPPPTDLNRLYLPSIVGQRGFHTLYHSLSGIGCYNLNPAAMRSPQPFAVQKMLARDGSNLALILEQLLADRSAKKRLEDYLAAILPAMQGIEVQARDDQRVIRLLLNMTGSSQPEFFTAASMSDGTMRAIGILVALLQPYSGWSPLFCLMMVDEPESGLHPFAAGVVLEAILEASGQTQVLAASHSPDFLANKDVETQSILAVMAERGETRIGPLNGQGRPILRDHLYAPGEILSMDELVIT